MKMDSDVLIIGAGTAGLTAAYELRKRGIRLQIIDEAEEVGSSWRHRHDQLSLNTYRGYSSLPGAPLPRRYGAYVRREDFISYLEEYSKDLEQPIRFGVSAQKIRRNGDEGWLVDTDQGEISARHVIVATGPERQPYTPEWPGRETFQGEFIHSAEFRHADDYIGKRVLLVGASNSGVDIGNHLSKVAIGPSWVSVRNGPTIVPTYVFGISAHIPFMWLRPLPIKMQDFMVAMLGRVFLGDLRKYGLPKPPAGAVTRDKEDGVTFGIDNGFVKALKAGRFTVVPEISSFEPQVVHLSDGRTIDPDVVICATGYRPGLEPLVGHLGVLNEHGKPRFFADQASSDHPGLWFFGTNTSIYGYLYARKQEAPPLADKIARSLQG
jgi:cation diffusion facilitator CzcD-associated flavoprotein CzcO